MFLMKKTLISLWVVFTVVLFSLRTISAQERGYGDPDLAYPDLPNWQERATIVLTNACRMDPVGYRDEYVGDYQILLPGSYPAVRPLYWQVDLNRAARAHAGDMSQNCGLQHNSCNGDSWSARITSYYKNSHSIAENIASGREHPQESMRQWIMDGTPPAGDKSGSDGHRVNIMNKNYREMGAGYAYGSVRYNHFWVQDFGGEKPAVNHPVPGGSHIFIKDSIRFMANYYDSLDRKPQKTMVVVDGQQWEMGLHLGTAGKGTYAKTAVSMKVCRNYCFLFTDADGKEWRFPEYGMLVTYGEGDCKTSYIPPEDVSVRTPLSGYRLVNQKGTAIMRTDLSGRIIQSGSNEGRVAGSSVNIMITNERKNSRLILDLNN
jgi:hypothetical protein